MSLALYTYGSQAALRSLPPNDALLLLPGILYDTHHESQQRNAAITADISHSAESLALSDTHIIEELVCQELCYNHN